MYNEKSRMEYSESLQKEKNINEKLGNSHIEVKQRLSILKMENDIMGEKLQKLYDATLTLGQTKMIEDKLNS